MTLQTFEQATIEAPNFVAQARTDVVIDPTPEHIEQYADALGDFVTGLVIEHAKSTLGPNLESKETQKVFFSGALPVAQVLRTERYLRAATEIDQEQQRERGVISSIRTWLGRRRAYKETMGIDAEIDQYQDLDTLTEQFSDAVRKKGINSLAELGAITHDAVRVKVNDELSPDQSKTADSNLRLAA